MLSDLAPVCGGSGNSHPSGTLIVFPSIQTAAGSVAPRARTPFKRFSLLCAGIHDTLKIQPTGMVSPVGSSLVLHPVHAHSFRLKNHFLLPYPDISLPLYYQG